MNSVFLSPNFPPNFFNFAKRLREAGATVLGLSDDDYDALNPQLRTSLTEYYRVSNLHNYDELQRALGYFTHRYGKISHLDSHNEYWLETEACLRTDFNIPGIKLDQIDRVKRKSVMKRMFLKAGLKPARGQVCKTYEELKEFIEEVGYPVVAKPDVGVGAAKTYKLSCDREVDEYWAEKPPEDYVVEEFVSGQIVTYDGLVDGNGDVIFSSSLRYSKGVMEAVNEDTDIYYYIVRDIEPFLEKAGRAILRVFEVKARFFHFEFFLTGDGDAIPLEVNMRPPGGLTLDMFNYLFDFDCYEVWAQMIVHGISKPVCDRKYFVMYVGRKDHIRYSLDHGQVLTTHSKLIVHQERINSIFARAIGNHGYLLRHSEIEPLVEAAELIQERCA